MRIRALSFASVVLPLIVTACGDEAPIYPPIVIVVGNQGGTGNVPGNGSGNNTGNGNNTSQGGTNAQGASPSGGSSISGSGSVDPVFGHCTQFAAAPSPPVETACDLDALEDGGDIKGDIASDRTLESGHSYTLDGVVRVMPGKKLTIEPCVKIMGKDPNSVLVTMSSELGDPTDGCSYESGSMTPSAQIVAVGEPMAPIVFTSSKPAGSRAPGDWGGVILLGNAYNNLATQNGRVGAEGLLRAECHGYYTDEFNDESSGHLEYVRVEYASNQVRENVETNGLTFASVGSGTEVHYVMVSNSGDDCFEWFGGAVNADHLIGLNCDDDIFDMDTGYSGKLQFLFGRQFATNTEDESRGFEMSKTATLASAKSTSVAVSNYTLCGAGPSASLTRSRVGMNFRDDMSAVTLQNGFVTGFTRGGLNIDTPATPPQITNTRIFETMPTAIAGGEIFTAGLGNSVVDPDRFCDCWTTPPAPVAATPIEGAAPEGFVDADASYLGAFENASPDSNWMTGLWVDWSSK
jgi:hypothetical protein